MSEKYGKIKAGFYAVREAGRNIQSEIQRRRALGRMEDGMNKSLRTAQETDPADTETILQAMQDIIALSQQSIKAGGTPTFFIRPETLERLKESPINHGLAQNNMSTLKEIPATLFIFQDLHQN